MVTYVQCIKIQTAWKRKRKNSTKLSCNCPFNLFHIPKSLKYSLSSSGKSRSDSLSSSFKAFPPVKTGYCQLFYPYKMILWNYVIFPIILVKLIDHMIDWNRSHYSVKLDCIAIGDFIIIDFIIFIDSTIRDRKMLKMVNMDSKQESKNNQWLVDKFWFAKVTLTKRIRKLVGSCDRQKDYTRKIRSSLNNSITFTKISKNM